MTAVLHIIVDPRQTEPQPEIIRTNRKWKQYIVRYSGERTIDALQRALEAAGVEFINGDQPGVRLTKATAARSAEPANASRPTVAAKAVGRKTGKETEKKR